MAPQSRAAFEADLARIGYGEPDSYDSDRCTHDAARTYTLFVLQHEACHEGARTFGDLRWIVYAGCLPCVTALENVVACGGLYRNARLFADGLDASATGQLHFDEIPPAATPLPNDDADDDVDGDLDG